ncbi:MAG TPA: aldose 1-epimerase family protein [Candidatus Limnocylindria bacterium]|nr:aldose 1-epimerase family protein [Candidatus Limnocylindria bacterium]
MKRQEEQALRRKIGDLDAHCGWKDYTVNDGPARGVRALDLNNGRNVRVTVLADRGMDVAGLSYRGLQAAFLSKTGVRSPFLYQEDGARGFLRQFTAGLLTTCGLAYAGAPFEEDGLKYGLHGPFSNTPARGVLAEKAYEGDDAVLRVAGEVRQAEVFGAHLSLTREIRLETERDVLRIEDTVENRGFEESPLMLVYHVNFGYPLLDAGARIYSGASSVEPRDENARRGMDRWDRAEEPQASIPEECFFHTGYAEEGWAMLHNPALGAAAILRFDAQALPLLCEWKCMREGDYALGLEPTTSGVLGRPAARKDGTLAFLQPGERRTFRLGIEFTDDAARIGKYAVNRAGVKA